MNSETHISNNERNSSENGSELGIRRILRRIVVVSHRFTNSRVGMHPYHAMFDLGLVTLIGFTFVFASVLKQFAVWKFIAAFVFTTLTYEIGFLKFKHDVLKIHSRSYLQDLLTYVLPVWIGSAWFIGVDFDIIVDLIGLQLALLMGFIRIGCFLGGCCYGVASKWGIDYPKKIFQPHEGGCQSFSPGEYPKQRVFPIQLIESVVNFALFGLLFLRLTMYGIDGLTLPLYLLLYSVYRFFSDFFRLSSARPNWGPFSEAQWVSVGLTIVMAIILVSTTIQ